MSTEATNATLIERRDVTPVLSIVKVRPDGGRVPPFEPGQFFRLGLPRTEADGAVAVRASGRVRYTKRAYSVASSPLVTDHIELFVVRIEEGALTPRLWELEVGDRLWLDGEAKGEFSLSLAPPGSDLVMVATGTGVAPFVSMLRTFRGQRHWRRCVVIHGARLAADLGYDEELAATAAADPTVHFIPLATREPADSGWPGRRGRVQTVLEPAVYRELVGAELDPGRCHVFLCGNPAMIDAVETLLVARGFVTDTHEQRGNLHFERYW